jgi:hypothetical protein
VAPDQQLVGRSCEITIGREKLGGAAVAEGNQAIKRWSPDGRKFLPSMPLPTPVDTSAKTFTVDGVEFVQGFMGTSTSGRFVITKQGPILDAYVDLLRESDGRTMVELGIYAGGSTVLAVLLGNSWISAWRSSPRARFRSPAHR